MCYLFSSSHFVQIDNLHKHFHIHKTAHLTHTHTLITIIVQRVIINADETIHTNVCNLIGFACVRVKFLCMKNEMSKYLWARVQKWAATTFWAFYWKLWTVLFPCYKSFTNKNHYELTVCSCALGIYFIFYCVCWNSLFALHAYTHRRASERKREIRVCVQINRCICSTHINFELCNIVISRDLVNKIDANTWKRR